VGKVGLSNWVEQQITGGAHSPANYNNLRVKNSGQAANRLAQPGAQFGKNLQRTRIFFEDRGVHLSTR
jgi:hypothetical protein